MDERKLRSKVLGITERRYGYTALKPWTEKWDISERDPRLDIRLDHKSRVFSDTYGHHGSATFMLSSHTLSCHYRDGCAPLNINDCRLATGSYVLMDGRTRTSSQKVEYRTTYRTSGANRESKLTCCYWDNDSVLELLACQSPVRGLLGPIDNASLPLPRQRIPPPLQVTYLLPCLPSFLPSSILLRD